MFWCTTFDELQEMYLKQIIYYIPKDCTIVNFVSDRYAFEQSLCDKEESKNHETDSSDKYDNMIQVKAAVTNLTIF